MTKIVNSYRFLDVVTSRMMKHWVALGALQQIPSIWI